MTNVKDCNGDTPRDCAATRIAIKIMDGEARRGSQGNIYTLHNQKHQF